MVVQQRKVRFGVQATPERSTWPELVQTFQRAEDIGLDTAWLPDHYLPVLTRDPTGPHADAWALLPALAASTRSIRIGSLVTCNNFRHPAVLARMAANVDVISGGRLEFGIGAGWFELEHTAYGIPFPPPRERLERLGEALDVIKLLWTATGSTFTGRYYSLREASLAPGPVQRPHPPILVGGGGERLTLAIVARHADEWNHSGNLASFIHKGAVLDGHCRRIGRDPSQIRRSIAIPMSLTDDAGQAEKSVQTIASRRGTTVEEARSRMLCGTPEMVALQVRQFVEAGADHIILQIAGLRQMDSVARFAREVIPRFREGQ